MRTNKQISQLFQELSKFSERVIEFNAPVNEFLISKFEKENDILLPKEYKQFLSVSNGLNLMGDEILGLYDIKNTNDLFSVYRFEHFEVIRPMPKYLIPFSPDGGGGFYCFDTRISTNRGFSNQIVFWSTDYLYTDVDLPEITHNSMCDFIQECLIGWTLEVYDYNGNEK